MRDPEIMQQVKNILAEISKLAPGHSVEPVYYTHLTLPTILRV